jgi:hypothetical protein
MRILTDKELVELAEGLDAEDFAFAESRMPEPDPFTGKPGWLREIVEQGFVQARHIVFNGRKVGYLFYCFGPDCVYLNGGATVACAGVELSPMIHAAALQLAKANNKRYVKLETRRPGVIDYAVKHGFRISGVSLIKEVE